MFALIGAASRPGPLDFLKPVGDVLRFPFEHLLDILYVWLSHIAVPDCTMSSSMRWYSAGRVGGTLSAGGKLNVTPI